MGTDSVKEDLKYLTKEDMHNFVRSELIVGSADGGNKNLYMVTLKDRFVVVQREGRCQPDKCGSACCKFVDAQYLNDYSRGFFDEINEFGKPILKRKCNNLMKCGKCKVWKGKLPAACKQFPHPSDATYWHIMDVCTFKFKILYTILRHKQELTITEMIKNFEGQT